MEKELLKVTKVIGIIFNDKMLETIFSLVLALVAVQIFEVKIIVEF